MFVFKGPVDTVGSLDNILTVFTDTKSKLKEFIEKSTKRHEEVKLEIETIQKDLDKSTKVLTQVNNILGED